MPPSAACSSPRSTRWTATRQSNAAFLDANLAGVVVPPVAPGAVHVYHQYTIRVTDDRDGFVNALREEHQVGSGVYYPIPNHRLPSLAPYAPGLDLPETERAAREVVSAARASVAVARTTSSASSSAVNALSKEQAPDDACARDSSASA